VVPLARQSPELVALRSLLAALAGLAVAAEVAGEYRPCMVCPFSFLVVREVAAPASAAVTLAVVAPLTEEGAAEEAEAAAARAGMGHLFVEMAGCCCLARLFVVGALFPRHFVPAVALLVAELGLVTLAWLA
jgi:hypothetical protein